MGDKTCLYRQIRADFPKNVLQNFEGPSLNASFTVRFSAYISNDDNLALFTIRIS